MKKVSVRLDGQQVQVNAGETILQAAHQLGIFIPTLCHTKELQPEASCFVCVVELDSQDELVPACSTQVAQGMQIQTHSEKVIQARRSCVELLLSDHVGDCLGPCIAHCPAHIDIPGFVDCLAQGDSRRAYELIALSVPLVGVLGRVCKHPCETECRRQGIDEPVNICDLKRYVADSVFAEQTLPTPRSLKTTGKRVAIVGAGPAGLSAAYFLQLLGHACEVFDANQQPGGMLRYGIPSYRLPRDVLDREIEQIWCLGVGIHTQQRLGHDFTLSDLRREYDAVLLATGAQDSQGLGLEGERECSQVISGLSFLHKMNRFYNENNLAGQSVIVIGGGDVAIDAARVARRAGAEDVQLYCLEGCDEMPAGSEAVQAAQAEGVLIHHECGVARIEPTPNEIKITFCRCLAVCNEEGHFCPEYDENDTRSDHCQTLIVAIGQKVDTSVAAGIQLSRQATLASEAHTGQTNLDGVFAAGDCVSGPQSVVQAVARGRQVARAIDQYLCAQPIVGEQSLYCHSMGPSADLDLRLFGEVPHAARREALQKEAAVRFSNFEEINPGLDKDSALAEAQRCLRCGCRKASDCRLRSYAGLFTAQPKPLPIDPKRFWIDDSHPLVRFEAHKCIGCRTCVRISEELFQSDSMQTFGRGADLRVRPKAGTRLQDIDLAELRLMLDCCPVGALTYKTATGATHQVSC